MSFAASLSGLTSASTAIDIIGNNIANQQTYGFKSSKGRFSDVLAASLPGAPPASGASAGVSISLIRQSDQGSFFRSDNPLDVAIAGPGFFRLDKGGDITYTRDGRFTLGYDAANPDQTFLVNQTGSNVTGNGVTYTTDPKGVVVTGTAPQKITIDPVMPAKATSKVSVGVNLDARVASPAAAFDSTNPTTYNSTTALTVFDSKGASHDLRMYFAKPAAGSVWNLHTPLDDGSPTGPLALSFGTDGLLTTPMPLAPQNYTVEGGVSLQVALDFSGATQYGIAFNGDALTQNGWKKGEIQSAAGFSVGRDGVITGTYSNGQSRTVAQLVLANFINPDAMIDVGDAQWKANTDPVRGSGLEILDTPGKGKGGKGLGSVQGGTREQSNVDLSKELVSLIEQQRNYQASAQTFKILDQVLQNLANMAAR
jgi:flagellar hook protein FlgE